MIIYTMPLYNYEAIDPSGRKIKDALTSSNEGELKATLREKGLTPLSIKSGEARESRFF